MSQDVRKGTRFTACFPVQIGHPTYGYVMAKTLDVSTTGFLCSIASRYPTGGEIEIAIDIDGDATVRCVGMIMRERFSSNHRFTYGVRIIRFKDNGRTVWGEALLQILRKERLRDPVSNAN